MDFKNILLQPRKSGGVIDDLAGSIRKPPTCSLAFSFTYPCNNMSLCVFHSLFLIFIAIIHYLFIMV